MGDAVGWNLADIKAGLVDTPRHVSENLQWITEEGMLIIYNVSFSIMKLNLGLIMNTSRLLIHLSRSDPTCRINKID